MFGDDYDPIRKPFEVNRGNRRNIQLPGGIVAVGVNDQQVKVLTGRQAFVEKYCKDRGWDMLNLTIEQLLEVRAQPGWKEPA